MKSNNNLLDRKYIISLILILILMMVSIFFRLLVHQTVKDKWGEAYIDSETGVPFLTEMDSYFHLRMTKDILNYGHPGESIRDGKAWDDMKHAPEGAGIQNYKSIMAYITIVVYKIVSFFGNTSIDRIAYWIGTFLSALVIIPVFILTNKMKGRIAACVASVLASINYGYFVHTAPGFYDTDMVIMWASGFFFCFLSLFIMSLSEDSRKKRIIYGGLSVLSFVILFKSWDAYILYVGIAFLSLLIYLFVPIVFKKREAFADAKKHWIYVVVLLLGIILFTLVLDSGVIRSAITVVSGLFAESDKSIMPNTFVSISELRKPSLVAGGFEGLFQMRVLSDTNIGVINYVGGIVPVLTALAMGVLLIVRNVKEKLRFEHVLLLVWFLITLVLAFRALRFIMLFAAPVAILSGLFVGEICTLMSEKKMMDWKVYAVMLSLLTLFPALYGAFRSSADSGPMINESFAQTVYEIRDNTSEDTIVASWWDYGYFYQYKAGRRTLFDGGSQDGIRVYWVSRALATDNEELSANILNMLSGAGDEATEEMFEAFGETEETLALMDELLCSNKKEAIQKLINSGADSNKAEVISELLFPEERDPVICLITSDMPRISNWFYAFGFNNGEHVEEYDIFIDRIKYTPEEGMKAWQTSIYGQTANFIIEKSGDGYKAFVLTEDGNEFSNYVVDKVIEASTDNMTEYAFSSTSSEDSIHLTAVVSNVNDTYAVSLMTTKVAESVFGRLFYTGGAGLERYTSTEFQGGSGSLFYVDSH